MRTETAIKPQAVCILLVDDNNHGLIARKTVLEELGYKVQSAISGEEAFELFSKGKFEIVITDYRMPNMDGIQLIQKIRELRPEVPIVLLSGFVEPLGLDEKTVGADVVIAKSSNEVSHLVRAVRKLLDRGTAKKPPAPQRLLSRARAKAAS